MRHLSNPDRAVISIVSTGNESLDGQSRTISPQGQIDARHGFSNESAAGTASGVEAGASPQWGSNIGWLT